jgi:single-stranded-DNA-specific exonuclease
MNGETAVLKVDRAEAEQNATIWCAQTSVRGKDWGLPATVSTDAPEGVDAEAAAVARRRGVTDIDTYFRPSLASSMPDPNLLPNMAEAVRTVCDAVQAETPIGVYGDYDVDGATSVALVLRWLRLLKRDAIFHIPDRIAEGYGVSVGGVERLYAEGVRFLIVADSGTTAVEALARAAELGMTAVVLDHHEPGSVLPQAVIVNPKIGPKRDFGYLCSAGVVFLMLVGANRELERRDFFAGRTKPDLRKLLGLVALGTVADVVPLVGLNRAYVAAGIARMDEIEGMRAMVRATGQTEYTVSALGFVFGPCINAAGRIDDTRLGTVLLSSDDAEECDRIAVDLARINRERQEIQKRMVDEAIEQASAEGARSASVIVIHGQEWHPGVVGLAASKLREAFDRPAVVIGQYGKASCRSVEGFDLGSAVIAAREAGLLLAGGGHPMAAGFTIDPARIGEFRNFLTPLAAAAVRPLTSVDIAIPAGMLTPALVTALKSLAPFGNGNPNARIAVVGGVVKKIYEIKGRHLKFFLRGPHGETQAMLFNGVGTPFGEELRRVEGCRVDLLGTATIDSYNGVDTATLKPEDAMVAPRL